MAFAHKLLPSSLISALEMSNKFEELKELRLWLDSHLPQPSPKTRRMAIYYILRLLELRDETGKINEHPLIRLFPYLQDEKAKMELIYWQVIKNLPYIKDFALFLSENIEKEIISRKSASEFLYSLMKKESKDTFQSLLFLLEKFNLIKKNKKEIYLSHYSPSLISFSYALCEDMLKEGRTTIDLQKASNHRVARVFFMKEERVLSYLEEEKELWQIERRPPLNRLLLLVRSTDEVVDYLIKRRCN
ncbi:MAG: hypothetical protein ACP5KZ_06450 [bacterium]